MARTANVFARSMSNLVGMFLRQIVLSEKGSDFSVKTTVHIHRLFEKFGFDEVFGRSAVMELLGLKGSGVSKFLSNLVQVDIIEPVSGHGKEDMRGKKVTGNCRISVIHCYRTL